MTVPSADGAAETRNTASTVPRYDLDAWAKEFGVVAGITGADGGFDLGLWGEQAAGRVMDRWQGFLESFHGSFEQIVLGRQVHGRQTEAYVGRAKGLLIKDQLDGHATLERGVLLVVLVADCVPVYLLDADSKAVALLHAGWRGTAAGILAAGVNQLASLGSNDRSNVVMHCGVSICGNCYEVGPDVVRATCGRQVSEVEKVDLRAVLTEQAFNLGMRKVTRSSWCTVHDDGLFHSYRANGGGAGRMAAYLGVPLA